MLAPAHFLVSNGATVRVVDPRRGAVREAEGLDEVRPSPLAADPHQPGRAWCGTRDHGLFRSDDGGRSWRSAGLPDRRVTAVAVSPSQAGLVWVGTEPSMLWRSTDDGESWERREGLRDLPSSSEWSFPPRPETDHLRWIACHPADPGKLWLAVEAGALVRTPDGGATWRDRVAGGPRDTHEVAIHPDRPGTLRISAGDGYFESRDGGASWTTPREGLEVGYLRSVAVDPGDPDTVLVSAASKARRAYVAPEADGRLYRRAGDDAWTRVTAGWPDEAQGVAPLLAGGGGPGEVWAADQRGLHRSADGGRSWEEVAGFPTEVTRVDALARLPRGG